MFPCKKRGNDDNHDVDNLVIHAIEVEGDDIEANNVMFPTRQIDVLEDTGVHGHFLLPIPHHKNCNCHGVTKMVNGATVKMC